MNSKNITRRVVTISIIISLSVIFSYFDNLISNGIFSSLRVVIPSFKIGLANIAIILFVYKFKFSEGIISVFLKSVLVALLFTGPTGFMIGFPGTILSFVVMKLLIKVLNEEKYMPFVSALGGISHSLGQIISAFAIYGITRIEAFIVYAPLIFLVSIVSGILVGIVGKKTIKLIDNFQLIS